MPGFVFASTIPQLLLKPLYADESPKPTNKGKNGQAHKLMQAYSPDVRYSANVVLWRSVNEKNALTRDWEKYAEYDVNDRVWTVL